MVEFMREVRERIRLWTDIPTSVGIAPSKTLAKIIAVVGSEVCIYVIFCS